MKDYKGGYVIVDATGLDIANSGTVNGLYQQIKDAVAVNKAVMLRNVKNGTTTLTPMYSTVDVDDISNSVSLNVYGGVITVYNDDNVTFTEVDPSADIKALETEIAELGSDHITSIDELKEIAEGYKNKLVTFTATFNSTHFGESAMSVGIVSDSGQAILIVSFSDTKIFTGVYHTVMNSWLNRTVTPLTAYTPA